MTELEKAAREFQEKKFSFFNGKGLAGDLHRTFIEGAEWQAKQSPWISVVDRLPDAEIMGTNYMVLVKTFDCTHVVYDVSTVVFMSKRGFISHWMPIPE